MARGANRLSRWLQVAAADGVQETLERKQRGGLRRGGGLVTSRDRGR